MYIFIYFLYECVIVSDGKIQGNGWPRSRPEDRNSKKRVALALERKRVYVPFFFFSKKEEKKFITCSNLHLSNYSLSFSHTQKETCSLSHKADQELVTTSKRITRTELRPIQFNPNTLQSL